MAGIVDIVHIVRNTEFALADKVKDGSRTDFFGDDLGQEDKGCGKDDIEQDETLLK